jgi:hypothetical protein
MTDNNDNDLAFTDAVDPYQARNGRREALQFALPLIERGIDTAETLIKYADQIDAYLEDGSLPESE